MLIQGTGGVSLFSLQFAKAAGATPAGQIEMVRAVEAHDIKPVIDSTFPLERLTDAFCRMRSGGHIGKVCIEI